MSIESAIHELANIALDLDFSAMQAAITLDPECPSEYVLDPEERAEIRSYGERLIAERDAVLRARKMLVQALIAIEEKEQSK